MPMRALKISALLLSLFLVGGCTILRAGKLIAPEHFGLTPITSSIYVEAGADEATRAKLREAMEQAESAIRAAYGSANERPIVNACISEGCYKSFGGQGSIAKVYGGRILLSPRGLDWHFLAHEWSHAEMRSRLTVKAWWNMPQWFDEGIAVAVSEAPEHSEVHWQFLIASNASVAIPFKQACFVCHTLSTLAGLSELLKKENILHLQDTFFPADQLTPTSLRSSQG